MCWDREGQDFEPPEFAEGMVLVPPSDLPRPASPRFSSVQWSLLALASHLCTAPASVALCREPITRYWGLSPPAKPQVQRVQRNFVDNLRLRLDLEHCHVRWWHGSRPCPLKRRIVVRGFATRPTSILKEVTALQVPLVLTASGDSCGACLKLAAIPALKMQVPVLGAARADMMV